AGEAGGSLEETLQRLADYLERSRLLRGHVVNALIYPVILLAMVGLSMMFLLGYVVPQFAAMYESLDAPLPLFTRIVLALGLFVRDWWVVLLAVPARARGGRAGGRAAGASGRRSAGCRRGWRRAGRGRRGREAPRRAGPPGPR